MNRSVDVLFETPITFDVVDRVVHSPMVHVNVGGAITKLILDTGSTDHVLTIELVTRIGLESVSSEPGTDHAGVPVQSWSLGEVPARIEGCDVGLREAVATNGPAPFERWGIGGFLSPQKLHPSGFVVIDLVVNELLVVEGDAPNIRAWLEARSPALHAISLAREPGAALLVRAAVELSTA